MKSFYKLLALLVFTSGLFMGQAVAMDANQDEDIAREVPLLEDRATAILEEEADGEDLEEPLKERFKKLVEGLLSESQQYLLTEDQKSAREALMYLFQKIDSYLWSRAGVSLYVKVATMFCNESVKREIIVLECQIYQEMDKSVAGWLLRETEFDWSRFTLQDIVTDKVDEILKERATLERFKRNTKKFVVNFGKGRLTQKQKKEYVYCWLLLLKIDTDPRVRKFIPMCARVTKRCLNFLDESPESPAYQELAGLVYRLSQKIDDEVEAYNTEQKRDCEPSYIADEPSFTARVILGSMKRLISMGSAVLHTLRPGMLDEDLAR